MNVEIKIKIGDKEFTYDQAKAIYDELHKIFGPRLTIPGHLPIADKAKSYEYPYPAPIKLYEYPFPAPVFCEDKTK